MSYNDLIIRDAEFTNASVLFCAFHRSFCDAIKQYRNILSNISTEAVVSGEVREALLAYIAYVDSLETLSNDFSGRYETIVKVFLDRLEKADSYLFDAGSEYLIRYYTQEFFEYLLTCLDDPWCSWTDNFGDWLYGGVLKTLDFLGFDNIKRCLQSSHDNLLDYNNETEQGLKVLFDDVHRLDVTYGCSTPCGGDSFANSYFDSICLAMYAIRDMLNEMADIMSPDKSCFTVSEINDRLGRAFKDLATYYKEVIEVSNLLRAPTIEEISDFASQPWALVFFAGFRAPILEYIQEMNWLDSTQIIIFEMFDIAKDRLLRDYLGELIGLDDYDSYLIKKQMLAVLKDQAKDNLYTDSEYEKLVEDGKTLLKLYKTHGKALYDDLNKTRGEDGKLLLDGRTKEARQFREFLDSLGDAKKILEYGEVGITYLAELFADYSAGLEIIESYERNYKGDPEIEEAIAEIKALYNKEFGAWAKKAYDIVVSQAVDFAIEKLEDALKEAGVSVLQVVAAIEKIIDVTGKVTGLGAEAESKYSSLVTFQLYVSSEEAYRNAYDALKNAVPGTEEYEQAANDLKYCFELHKANIVQMYNDMANASSGDYEAYYKYCAKRAEELTMKSGVEPDIMSFEEFCANRP